MTAPQLQTPAPQTIATAGTWEADPNHSAAEFAVRHLMISTVRGRFALRSARVEIDPARPERARIDAEIDVASVDTGAKDRDAHLRSPDFFDAQNHPVMRFAARGIEDLGDGKHVVRGELTIRGVTRPVVLDVEREGETIDPWGKARVGLVARTTLDRSEFGLTWNQALETGGVLVGDKVKVALDLQLVRRD